MKKFSLLIIMFFLFPFTILASELDIKIECPDTILKDEEFTCDIKGISEYNISAIEYEFKLSDDLTKIKFDKAPIWEGDEKDNLLILYTDENKTGEFTLGSITLKSTKNIKKVEITTEWLLFGDENFKDHVVINNKLSENVKEVESNTKKERAPIIKFVVYAIIIIVVVLAVILFLYIKLHKKDYKKYN